jgi:hypothetical protein
VKDGNARPWSAVVEPSIQKIHQSSSVGVGLWGEISVWVKIDRAKKYTLYAG